MYTYIAQMNISIASVHFLLLPSLITFTQIRPLFQLFSSFFSSRSFSESFCTKRDYQARHPSIIKPGYFTLACTLLLNPLLSSLV